MQLDLGILLSGVGQTQGAVTMLDRVGSNEADSVELFCALYLSRPAIGDLEAGELTRLASMSYRSTNASLGAFLFL